MIRSTNLRGSFAVSMAFGALVAFSSTALAQKGDGNNPIGDIAVDMQSVVGKLTDLTTGEPTQGEQKTIISKLDKLIAELEKECEACKGQGASKANPRRPLADSVIMGGPGGIGDLHAAQKDGKKWGELPAHQREKIIQSLTEGFPPHYQKVLERYYRRVAEENADQPVEDAVEAIKASGAPKTPAKGKAASTKSVENSKRADAAPVKEKGSEGTQ